MNGKKTKQNKNTLTTPYEIKDGLHKNKNETKFPSENPIKEALLFKHI